jgi:hypothetical protein
VTKTKTAENASRETTYMFNDWRSIAAADAGFEPAHMADDDDRQRERPTHTEPARERTP